MTTPAISNSRYPICERARRIQDVLLVSSFGFWAAILGLSPVLAYGLLMNWRNSRGCSSLIGGSTCGQMRAKLRPAF
jgi:hypothetical protein